MDVRMVLDDKRFTYRASALIYNSDFSKILLFNVEGSDEYLLPGGKVKLGESSIEALKREIMEELGYSLDFSFAALCEEFVYSHGYDNHQLDLIYKGVYDKEIKRKSFHGFEGDWANYKWVDITDLEKYNLFPKQIKVIINNDSQIYHFINKKENE